MHLTALPRGGVVPVVQDASLPKSIRIGLALSISLVLLSASCLLVLRAAARQAALPVFGQVPDFNLVDQEGRPFTDEDLAGRVHVIGFIYTTCTDICPAITAQMRTLQTELARAGLTDQVHLVSLTVDPEHDTPERLAAYARMFGADTTSWHFLTGRPHHVRAVVEKGFLVGIERVEHDPIIHADHLGDASARGAEGTKSAHDAHGTNLGHANARGTGGAEGANDAHGTHHGHASARGAEGTEGAGGARETDHSRASAHGAEGTEGAGDARGTDRSHGDIGVVDYRIEHGGRVVLVDREGRIRAYHQGDLLDTDVVLAQIRRLLNGR